MRKYTLVAAFFLAAFAALAVFLAKGVLFLAWPSVMARFETHPRGLVTMEVGEIRLVRPHDGITVQALRIEDSRCPPDVACIWAGELGFVLKATQNGQPLVWQHAENGQLVATEEIRLSEKTNTKAVAGHYEFIYVAADPSHAPQTVSFRVQDME